MPRRSRRFLILHGAENRRPREHWQHHLAENLRERGEIVLYPQLPEPDAPSLDAWLELLRAELDQLGDGARVVVCHSLSVLLWIHHASSPRGSAPADRVLLVAPPSPAVLWPAVGAFAPRALDTEALSASSRTVPRLVCSDNDPYCPEGAADLFGAPLRLDVDVLPGAGHLSPDEGYGEWPHVLQWCFDPAVRLKPRD